MFSVNEYVIYGIYGVCKIIDIVEREICGRRGKFYVLKPVFEDKATVYIPVSNPELTAKMRRILSAEEIHKLIRNISSTKIVWIENEQDRKKEYSRILSGGDRSELILMIKSIYTHRQELLERKKKLHICDENFMKDAEKILYEEFAHVLNIKRSQVVPFIAEQIEVEERH